MGQRFGGGGGRGMGRGGKGYGGGRAMPAPPVAGPAPVAPQALSGALRAEPVAPGINGMGARSAVIAPQTPYEAAPGQTMGVPAASNGVGKPNWSVSPDWGRISAPVGGSRKRSFSGGNSY